MSKTLQIGILSFFALIVTGAFFIPSGKVTTNVEKVVTEYVPAIATGEEDVIPPDAIVQQTIKEVQKKRVARGVTSSAAATKPFCPLDLFLIPFKALGL